MFIKLLHITITYLIEGNQTYAGIFINPQTEKYLHRYSCKISASYISLPVKEQIVSTVGVAFRLVFRQNIFPIMFPPLCAVIKSKFKDFGFTLLHKKVYFLSVLSLLLSVQKSEAYKKTHFRSLKGYCFSHFRGTQLWNFPVSPTGSFPFAQV